MKRMSNCKRVNRRIVDNVCTMDTTCNNCRLECRSWRDERERITTRGISSSAFTGCRKCHQSYQGSWHVLVPPVRYLTWQLKLLNRPVSSIYDLTSGGKQRFANRMCRREQQFVISSLPGNLRWRTEIFKAILFHSQIKWVKFSIIMVLVIEKWRLLKDCWKAPLYCTGFLQRHSPIAQWGNSTCNQR